MKFNNVNTFSAYQGFDSASIVVANKMFMAYDKHCKMYVIGRFRYAKSFFEVDQMYDQQLYASKKEASKAFSKYLKTPQKMR